MLLPLSLGYEWLYTKPDIFHRDISINNMMYRKKDGKIFEFSMTMISLFSSKTTPLVQRPALVPSHPWQ